MRIALFILLLFPAYARAMCAEVTTGEGKTPYLAQLDSLRLETERLKIITPTAADLAPLLPLFQDRMATRHTWFASPEGVERWNSDTLRERFEWQAEEELKGQRRDFVIHTREGEVVGRCALYRPEELGDWEFGITLSQSAWGRGLGTEATRAVLQFAFMQLGAANVVLEVLPENSSMQKVCSKLNLRLLRAASDSPPAGPFRLKYDYYEAVPGISRP